VTLHGIPGLPLPRPLSVLRHLPCRPAPRAGDHGDRDRCRPGVRHHGRQRRRPGGQARVTKGPAVEAGTELDGYYIYDAPDLDAAIAFAARIPVARFGGTVEVRPMLER